MYQLGTVRVLTVGPPGRPFADECLDLGTTGAPDLLMGANGSGKTTFARLVQFVLTPHIVEGLARTGWSRFFPEHQLGHVVHEWRDPASDQSVVLGLAAMRSHGQLRCFRYSLRLRLGLDLRSLPLAKHSSSLEQLRSCLVEAASPDCGEPFFTAEEEAWRSHLKSFGLGGDSIYFPGEHGRRWTADRAAFVEEAIRWLASTVVVPELTETGGADLAPEQVVAQGLPAVKTLLRHLRAVEDLSTVPGPDGTQRPLVRLRFADPSDEMLREQLKALVKRAAPREWHAAVAVAAIRHTVDVSILVDLVREPRYVSLDHWESSTSWMTQEVTAVVLNSVFARVRASLSGTGAVPVLAFVDLPWTATAARPEAEILRHWGQHIVYLMAGQALDTRQSTPGDAGRIFNIVDVERRDDGERHSRIASAVALASVKADRADQRDFEPLTDVFDVLDPAAGAWQDSDLIVPHYRWCGTSDNVWIASALQPSSVARFAILRPVHTLPPGAALLYSRYLGGDAIFGDEAVSRRQLVTISPDDLADLMVPRLDRSTLRAIADLTAAADDFDQWRRQTMTAVDLFFQWRDISAARAEIIAAGRLTRQRWEAAQVLDAFASRVRTTLPHPIASRWRSLDAARPDEAGYRAVLDCAETVVTYCAAVGVQFAFAHQVALPKLRALSSKIKQGTPISFGVWTTMLADLAGVASTASIPADSPLRNFAQFGGDIALAVADLKERRNHMAHGRVPAVHEFAPLCESARAELEKVIAAAEWLADYPLRHVDEALWDSYSNSTQVAFRELMGDHSVVRLRRDTTTGNVEVFSPYAVDQFGRYYLLRPLLHTAVCQGCGQLSVFVLDRWSPDEHRAEFKALNHGDVCHVSCESALRAVGLLTT